MLILRRRAGEAILIGEDVEIRVEEVSGSRVKLAVSAPPGVSVVRKEARLVRDQNVRASRGVSAQAVGELLRRFRP